MRQHKKEQYGEVAPMPGKDTDSPTIRHLIEQLERDLQETERKASNAQ